MIVDELEPQLLSFAKYASAFFKMSRSCSARASCLRSSTVSADAWTFLVYVTAFPYLGWTFVPVLALHGILFGRVANYASPRSQYLIDAGVLLLFAVAAATTAVILQNPGATAFVRSWSVGRGILPAAALSGYALIAAGLTVRPAPVRPRVRTWTPQRIR